MKKLVVFLLILCLAVPALSCAETVVTSFYPVWILTRNLTEGLENVNVVNMAEPTVGCLHDYTLQPSDMVALSGADLFLINGLGMEAFLPAVTAAFPDLPVVDASVGLPVLALGDTVTFGEPEEDETVNPHIWLNPRLAAGMADNLAEGLRQLLPDQAGRIDQNLTAFQVRLSALEEALQSGVQPLKNQRVLIFHEAFPYLMDACFLPVAAVVCKEPDENLTASQLARILTFIRSEASLPLIVKSAEPDVAVDTLVGETGIPVCELDPLTSGPENPPLNYYEEVILRNLKALLESVY